MQADSAGYDPKRSRVSDDTMTDFIRGRVTGDLQEVPGIGPATAKKLGEGEDGEEVTNTYQLFGKVSAACLGRFIPYYLFVSSYVRGRNSPLFTLSLVSYAERTRLGRQQSRMHGAL